MLITVEEFAELMRTSVRSIWRWNSAHSLPKPVRVGRAVRWRREEVMEWIKAGCPSTSSRENDRGRN